MVGSSPGSQLGLFAALHSEYGLDGWTVPDLINPDDVSIVMKK